MLAALLIPAALLSFAFTGWLDAPTERLPRRLPHRSRVRRSVSRAGTLPPGPAIPMHLIDGLGSSVRPTHHQFCRYGLATASSLVAADLLLRVI
jgi:hypothetical protein